MQLIVFPLTFVGYVSIYIVKCSSTFHSVPTPLASISASFIIVERSKSLSHVIFLITFIPSFRVKLSYILFSLIFFWWIAFFASNKISIIFHHVWLISKSCSIELFDLCLNEKLFSLIAFFFIQNLDINIIKIVMIADLIFTIFLHWTKAFEVGLLTNLQNRFFQFVDNRIFFLLWVPLQNEKEHFFYFREG